MAELESAAESGDMESQYLLGVAYCTGQNRNVDFKEGAKWLKLSADQGYLAAKRELGILYLTGEGVDADADKAYPLLSEAARESDPNAMYHLAFMYEKGVGVKKDLYEALKLLAFAANMEYPGADEDADRVEEMICREREKKLKARPLLNLDISDVDVEAACCKPMFESILNGEIYVEDTYQGPELIGEDDKGFEVIITQCPFCGKKIRRVGRDKEY